MVTIAVPPGIGDSLWALTKVQAILQAEKAEAARILICTNDRRPAINNRSVEFLRSFSFIGDVGHVVYPIHPPNRPADPDGLVYAMSRRADDPQSKRLGIDWVLIPNHTIERGQRLETWLPDYRTNFDLMLEFQYPEAVHPEVYRHVGRRYFVVYASQTQFYEAGRPGFNFHNRQHPAHWSIGDWTRTIQLLAKRFDMTPILVGADYDASCANVIVAAGAASVGAVNLCSVLPIWDTIRLLRGAAFVVGYPSGIPIVSTYLRRPTVMMWNTNPVCVVGGHRQARRGSTKRWRAEEPLSGGVEVRFNRDFATAWVPPDCIGTTYAPLRFGEHGPADVVEAVARMCEPVKRSQEAAA